MNISYQNCVIYDVAITNEKFQKLHHQMYNFSWNMSAAFATWHIYAYFIIGKYNQPVEYITWLMNYNENYTCNYYKTCTGMNL